MLDLKNNKYDLKTLKENIYAVDLLDILKTQTITWEFALKYILNKKYQLTKEEERITINDVFLYQPHLLEYSTLLETNTCLKKVDSFENFDDFCNKN